MVAPLNAGPSSRPGQLSLFGRLVEAEPVVAEPVVAEPVPPPPTTRETARPPTVLSPGAAADVATRLTRLADEPVTVVLTNNRSRIFSARPVPKGWSVRLHRCFAAAPDPVLRAVLALARRRRGTPVPRKALALLRAHHAAATSGTTSNTSDRASTVRTPALMPVGRTLDLRVLRDEINQDWFAGALDVKITWGAAPRRGRRTPRSIRLGSYNAGTGIVRIHRALDAPDVPRYVVAAIVHHEMLHAAMPPEPCGGGRRVVHSPAFRAREQLYEHHARSEAWIRRHLNRLLRRAIKRGRAF